MRNFLAHLRAVLFHTHFKKMTDEFVEREKQLEKMKRKIAVKHKIARETTDGLRAAINGNDEKWFICLTKDTKTCDHPNGESHA